MITNALCNIAESSGSSTVANIRNESLNEALILARTAALPHFMKRRNIFPNTAYA